MTDRDRDLQVVVIGYGLAGSVFHAPLIAAVDGLRVAAVITRDPSRRAEAETRYPGVRVLEDPGPVWDDPARFDLVVVATPNRVHVDLACRALAAGLSVVVDKPAAATTADALRLKRAAEAAGRPLGVFHNRRWDGDLLTVSQLIADGQLGKVHRFESHFERWRPQVRVAAWREQSDPAEAGGLLYDLGTHLIDQALTLFGPVSRVYAEPRIVRDGAQVDDDVFLALTHRTGVQAHLWASSSAADAAPRMRVLGSKAAYVKYGLDGQEDALRGGEVPTGADWGVEPPERWGRIGVPDATEPVPTRPGNYPEFYRQVRDALRGDGSMPVGIDDALATLSVIEAAQTSSRTGTTAEINSPAEQG